MIVKYDSFRGKTQLDIGSLLIVNTSHTGFDLPTDLIDC